MPRILTEILGERETVRKKLKLIGENKIQLKKAKGTQAEYEPTFTRDSIITYRVKLIPFLPFTILKQKLMMYEDADQCIEFNKTDGITTQPMWDRDVEERAYNVGALRVAGMEEKIKIPTSFLILSILSVGLSFLTLLVVSGRLRI